MILAAHCFYDELNGKPFNERFYEVAVSKVTRNYTIKDNAQTKLYTVSIHPECNK